MIQEKIEQNQTALRDILAKRSADGTFPADVQEQIKRANADLIALKEQGEIERIASAAKSCDIVLEREDWYALWEAAQGRNIP